MSAGLFQHTLSRFGLTQLNLLTEEFTERFGSLADTFTGSGRKILDRFGRQYTTQTGERL